MIIRAKPRKAASQVKVDLKLASATAPAETAYTDIKCYFTGRKLVTVSDGMLPVPPQ
jgi:hypothetical protein